MTVSDPLIVRSLNRNKIQFRSCGNSSSYRKAAAAATAVAAAKAATAVAVTAATAATAASSINYHPYLHILQIIGRINM